MKLNNTLIVLLSILMLAIIAGVAFAEDVPLNNTSDDGTITEDNTTDVEEDEGDGEEFEEELTPVNESDYGPMIGSAAYEEPVNESFSASSSECSTASASQSSSNLANNATGNPLFILLIAIAGVGLSSISRRK